MTVRRLEIRTAPVPWKRARRNGDTYYDSQVKDKAVYAYIARAALKKYIPVEGPIRLILRFHLGMPQSWSKKKKEAMNGRFCDAKPDLDNYVKFVLDAFSQVIWLDDKQVVSIEASKVYSFQPKTEVEYEEVSPN